MGQLADDLAAAPPNGSNGDVGRELASLAERMRGTVTPVIGYLELISQEASAAPAERHVQWIATIERRLDAMRELNDQISRVCAVLRQAADDREATTRRDPEAPAG
jgi:hypothetical protein